MGFIGSSVICIWSRCHLQGAIVTASVYLFNSLRPGDAIWQHRTGSTLAQVMACCLTAPSHYLNQYWLIINWILWHLPKTNFIENTQDVNSSNEFEKIFFKIPSTYLRGQWVKEQYWNGISHPFLCLHLLSDEALMFWYTAYHTCFIMISKCCAMRNQKLLW